MQDKLQAFIAKNWKQYLAWALLTAATCAGAYLAGTDWSGPPPLPNPIFKVPTQADADHADNGGDYNFGWHKDDDAVKAVQGTLPFQVFGDTPAGQVQAVPDRFYQWQVWRKHDPRGPPAKNQGNVGSCVSFGTNNAIARTMACQIALHAAAEEIKDIAEEVTYAGSRVEIGGGRIRGDGSVGAWAAQFVQKYGVVSREKHGQYDLSKYDTARCRAWGQSGVPADLEPLAREHPVKDITLVKTLAELKLALSQGYGVAVCSNQGFAMTRDSRGVARASGSWAHCMCIDGYHTEGGQEFYHIENSWGDKSMQGPTGWGDPSGAGFWAEASVVQRMLAAGDTWAFSGVKGFPARESDWFVQLNQPAERTTRVASALLNWRNLPCETFLLCP
jgi:hypothetical protein